jgi:hypothetical protein
MVATLVATGSALAAPQDIPLYFTSLPSAQGFTYSPVGSHAGAVEANIFSVSSNRLIQNSMGQGHGVSGGGILYVIPGIMTTTEPKKLLVTARCLQVEGSGAGALGQQGFAFGFNTGSVQYDISLTPTAIYTLGPGGSVLVAGTYDNTQFHDYILEFVPPGTFKIYRDGALLHTGTSGFAFASNRLFFGDGTGGANAHAEILAFRFSARCRDRDRSDELAGGQEPVQVGRTQSFPARPAIVRCKDGLPRHARGRPFALAKRRARTGCPVANASVTHPQQA